MTNRADGPFSAGKCQVYTEEQGQYDGAAVFDSEGQPFCLISDDSAVGGHHGAMARATRIAEALNQQSGYGKPTPFIDDQGNLRAPAGYGFVAKANGAEMVPLVSVTFGPSTSVFADGEEKLPSYEYEKRAGVVIGQEFVYPDTAP